MESLMDKVAMGQVFLQVLWLSPLSIIQPITLGNKILAHERFIVFVT